MGLVLGATLRAESVDTAGTMPEDLLPELKNILNNALRQAPQTVARELEITMAQARIYGADAPRLPGVGGNISYASNEQSTSSNSSSRSKDSGVFYSLGVSQAIYHWGALKNQSDQARIGVLIAEKNYKQAYSTLAVMLRRAYLDLIVRKSILESMRFVRKAKTDERDSIAERVKDGRAAAGDLTGRNLDLEDWSFQVRKTEIEFNAMRRAFGRLAGIPDPTEDSIPSEIPKPNYSEATAKALLDGIVHDGGRSTFQAQVAALRIQDSILEYKKARVRLLPRFDAGANYSLNNNTTAAGNSVSQQAVTQRSVSITANWSIFDGFATKGAKLEALTTRRIRERELESITETALDSVQGLAELVALDATAMDMADFRRGLASAGVGRAKEEVDYGKASQTLVTQATASLKDKSAALAATRASFLARWSDFVAQASTDPVLSNIPARYDREKR